MLYNKIKLASIIGALAVILGAFGAHGIEGKISPSLMHAYQTGVQYHFYHLMAMLICILLLYHHNIKYLGWAFNFFWIGICLFSGSLYGMALAELSGYTLKILGPITPIGGIFFILGWLCLFYSALKKG